MRLSLLVLLLGACLPTPAQSDLAIGQWRSHLPFQHGTYVTQSPEKVFYATPFAVLAIDKEELSIERLTKVEGLSQVGVRFIEYSRGGEVLLVVYEDGVIDLVREDGITTILNIPESDIIIGEKVIGDLFFADDSTAYLAANFGVTKFDFRRGLFPSTTKTPLEVNSVVVFEGQLVLSTDEGLYAAPLDGSVNLDDFSNWEWWGPERGFPADYSTGPLVLFQQRLYLDLNDSLYRWDGAALQYVHSEAGYDLRFLSADGPHLIAGFRGGGSSARVWLFDEDQNATPSPAQCFFKPTHAIEDESGRIWYADESSNFGYRYARPGDGSCQVLRVNSPFSENVREITIHDNQVWIASGGVTISYTYLFRNHGFFSLIDGQWSVYNKFNVPAIQEKNLDDFYTIRVHPETGKVYAGSFLDGLVELDPATGEAVVYDDSNSSLNNAIGDEQRTRVSGLAFDQDLNLWVSNHAAERPLSVLKNDGTWQSFSPGCTSSKGFVDLTVDFFGYKWIILSDENLGLLVFDEGDMDDPTDDRCRMLNANNSNLPSNRVNAIEVDLDGSVWVGTLQGPVVFECDVLGNPDCIGSLRIVEQDNFGAYLLEDEDVRTIAVDGANRKWFGTANGIFVQSPSGDQQEAAFNEDNSPLFSNGIIDIAINHQTGEVFIGTEKGLQSMRAEATLGGVRHSSNVVVFPNPVRPDYNGLIAIKGLAQDANVKITDINGQLLFETTALGGQAVWDGRDYNGRKANSGVYLVLATSKNLQNPHAVVAKILFLN